MAADNVAGTSAWSNTLTVAVARPATPTILTATAVRSGSAERVTLTWSPVPWATSYVIQRSADPAFASGVTTTALGNVTTYTTGNIARRAWRLPSLRGQRARPVRPVDSADPGSGAVTVKPPTV